MKSKAQPVVADSARSSDPEKGPASAAKVKRTQMAESVRSLRHQLGMTQEQFSQNYWIPLHSLRQYEMARYMPPPATRSYLKVIEAEPEMVQRILAQ